MGCYIMFGTCVACERPFTFNPRLVPSVRRQPICIDCVNKVNSLRIGKGLHPIPVHPDAYRPASEQDNDNDDYEEQERIENCHQREKYD